MRVFEKDPNAIKDYSRDWTRYLESDTITTSEWIAEDGITIDSDSNDTTSSTVWLSGGEEGCEYVVTNRITTAGGRTDDRSFIIRMVDK